MKKLVIACLPLLFSATSLLACSEPLPTTCEGRPDMALVPIQHTTNEPLPTCVDIHVASRRDATETSPGRDSSYAVSQPNAIPWTNVSFAEASAACGRAGKYLCDKTTASRLVVVGPPRRINRIYDYLTDAITALRPTGPELSHPDQRRLGYFDPHFADPAFPDTVGSVAVWTTEDIFEVTSHDMPRDTPYIVGALYDDFAISGVAQPSRMDEADFQHPLLGFRCCLDARLLDVFEALPPDERHILPEEPDVPIMEDIP